MLAAGIPPMTKGGRVWSRRALGGGALAATLLILLACRGGDATVTIVPPGSSNTTGQVKGLIVGVVGRNIVELETLRVRAEDGKVWTFTAEGPLEFSPSHLREHQLFGQAVVVSYVRQGESLVAVEITD